MENEKVKFERGTSTKYQTAIKNENTFYFTTDDKQLYLGDIKISETNTEEIQISEEEPTDTNIKMWITESDNTVNIPLIDDEHISSADTWSSNKINTLIDGKVDKVEGMGLSHNDFTDIDKDKLDNLGTAAQKNYITSITDSTNLPTASAVKTYVDNAVVGGSSYLGTITAITELSTTATKGSFYRVSTAWTDVHVGDIIIAEKDSPAQIIDGENWTLLHNEINTDTTYTFEGGTNSFKVIPLGGTEQTIDIDQNFDTDADNIKMNGEASVGTLTTVSRADHVHPTDTTRASAEDLTELTNIVNNFSGAVVSKLEPTTEGVVIWVNPDSDETAYIPLADDEHISTKDTWSSKKISDEIANVVNNICLTSPNGTKYKLSVSNDGTLTTEII